MKKIILIACIALGFSTIVRAQFTVADTVNVWNNGAPFFNDHVTNTGSSIIHIYWNVVATDFPTDWLTSLSLCDNYQCYSNGPSKVLWNGISGSMWRSDTLKPGIPADFHMINTFVGLSTGTHWLTVRLTDSTGNVKYSTYVIKNPVLAVNGIVKSEDDVVLYPNPASNELNVVFSQDASVKNITVCDIIGKVVNVFKVNGNSANLDISNVPSGIYFVRLINAQGNIVATRKFNKQ